jgi:hypothetical protein
MRTGAVRSTWAARIMMLTLFCLAPACSERETNFSQHPGFAEWYAAQPPSKELPTAAERVLLERHRPRVFLPEGHAGPIDFYRDYIAQGRLYDLTGAPLSSEVTPELLNAHKHDPRAVFEHAPTGEAPRPVIYGRVDRDALLLPGCEAAQPVTFLTYHLVFRYSGLPAGVPWWQAAPLALIADLDDWHQLDHYTAVTLALAPDPAGALLPFAATFQHHNYLRTYRLGASDGPGRLGIPADGRLPVDVALRSNELYPHQRGRTVRRAVGFLTPQSARYLVDGVDRPWRAADDVTAPAREIETTLEFLPPADAFYVFQGWLGERRLLPGRDGPPGADYNTLPAFKPKAVQLALFYWREEDADSLAALDELLGDGRPQRVDPASRFASRLVADLSADRAIRLACADQAAVRPS